MAGNFLTEALSTEKFQFENSHSLILQSDIYQSKGNEPHILHSGFWNVSQL